MSTYAEVGGCSSCGQSAKADEDGFWWHVGPSCLPPHVRSPEVFFVPASNESKPAETGTQPRRKAREVADRQQRQAPADRSLSGSERDR